MGYTKEDLARMFKKPCEVIMTNGTQEGVILKFLTYYLKIYDGPKRDTYIVQCYRYNEVSPVFVDSVPYNQMRKYASEF